MVSSSSTNSHSSFRKAGLYEFQPDLAFYLGSDLRVPPETNSPVDLNEYDPPKLVVEIGASSLSDDLGWKRLLYERAGVQEYWVNDANAHRAIAFAIAERRSGEIQESQVLPSLSIAIVEEALQRSQTQCSVAEITIQLKKVKKSTVQAFLPSAFCLYLL